MGINLNPLHDAESFWRGGEHLADEVKDDLFGSSAAVPKPGRFTGSALPQSAWRAAPSGGSGQMSVHKDVLTKTSALIKGDVQDLGQVMSSFGSAISGGITVTGWPTADGFTGNVATVNQAMSASGAQVSNAHLTAAGRLSATAGTYDTVESDIIRAIGGIAAQLDVSAS